MVLIVILIIVIACLILKGLFQGAGNVLEGVNNMIDPKTTDLSSTNLIAKAAQLTIDNHLPNNSIRVLEFLPKEKSLPIMVTNSEDIELIKEVKNISKFEITTLSKYKKNYWDGILYLEISGKKIEVAARAAIYTDQEDRGGFATCNGYLDLENIKSIVENCNNNTTYVDKD